jgi:hypothetical protein
VFITFQHQAQANPTPLTPDGSTFTLTASSTLPLGGSSAFNPANAIAGSVHTSVYTSGQYSITLSSGAFVDPTTANTVDFVYQLSSSTGLPAGAVITGVSIPGFSDPPLTLYAFDTNGTNPASSASLDSFGDLTFSWGSSGFTPGSITGSAGFGVQVQPVDAADVATILTTIDGEYNSNQSSVTLTAAGVSETITGTSVPEASTCLFGVAILGAVVGSRKRRNLTSLVARA